MMVEGKATTLCNVTSKGRLSDCEVIDEAPLGCGFGEAALKLNRYMAIAPLANDGSPTPSRAFKFVLALKLPDGVPSAATNCD